MEWIKCSDRLPDENEPVLIYRDLGISSGLVSGLKWYYIDSLGNVSSLEYPGDYETEWTYEKPTHWQPFPKPPKEQQIKELEEKLKELKGE